MLLVPTLILAVWAAGWVISTTRDSTPELQGDSAVYLSTAEGLRSTALPTVGFNLDWDGYTPNQAFGFHGRVPASHFPPGYPLALATTSFFTGGVRSAARAIDVVLVVVNLLLLALLTARMTANRSILVATLPAVVVLFVSDARFSFFFPDVNGWLNLHHTVASEPLFMACFMIEILALQRVLEAGPLVSRRAFALAAIASSAALLTRYVGIACVLIGVVALLVLDHRRALDQRLRRAAIFSAASLVPTLLFLGWARIVGGASPRTAIFNPLLSTVRAPFETLALYTMPAGGRYALRILIIVTVLALVVIGAIFGARPRELTTEEDQRARSLLHLGLLSIATYALVVMATVTFFDRYTPIDARMFAPIRGLWYAIVVAVAYRVLARVVAKFFAVATITILAILLVTASWSQTRRLLTEERPKPPPRTTVTSAIARIPDHALVVSNAPDSVYDMTRRNSIALPFPSGASKAGYEQRMSEIVQLMTRHGGYLALVQFPGNPATIPSALQASLTFDLVAQSPQAAPTSLLYRVHEVNGQP